MNWTLSKDVNCPFVARMSRNRFPETKALLHVCDNNQLDQNDKWCKLGLLVEAVNKKLMQFGIFSYYLSIDQQMVPYFGRHSRTLFIRGKPIRFGYKNWGLCGHDGYPYQVHPYQGRENNPQGRPLGTKVVNSLCNIVENAENHEVYFDNLFTSISLLDDMRRRKMKATGTLRSNKVLDCPVTKCETIKKTERGFFEEHNCGHISIVRWNDNQVVTLSSNHSTFSPTSTCR